MLCVATAKIISRRPHRSLRPGERVTDEEGRDEAAGPGASGQARFQEQDSLRELEPVASPEEVAELQEVRKKITVSTPVRVYITSLVRATRVSSALRLGASPRGSLALMRTGQALAGHRGRDFVLPDDVKSLALPVLAHRLTLREEERLRGATQERVLEEILGQVPIPAPWSEGGRGRTGAALLEPLPASPGPRVRGGPPCPRSHSLGRPLPLPAAPFPSVQNTGSPRPSAPHLPARMALAARDVSIEASGTPGRYAVRPRQWPARIKVLWRGG